MYLNQPIHVSVVAAVCLNQPIHVSVVAAVCI